jgi:hypothetical protein
VTREPLHATPTCVDLDVLAAERVKCAPLHLELSALACAKQHVVAKSKRKLRPDEWHNPIGSPCRACEVGAANARRARL